MKKSFYFLMGLLMLVSFTSRADEGMWIPGHMSKMNYADMQKLGCELTPEQIYSINNSSMKDAIFQLLGEGGNGFCTGEIVSTKGLLFTNHHCGYEAIATLSTLENNYLDNGYWARNYGEEISVPGVSVSRVVRIEHVTDRVLAGITAETPGSERDSKIKKAIAEIEKEAKGNTHYEVKVKEMYKGGEYYLFVYEVFGDVRFVGAPPSSIGKFGGDTDNWMWPRHTGDFSMFRVYMSPDGMPTEGYDKNNVPYKPLHYLPISIKGIEEGDFTMIMGYPGETERYLSSAGMEFKRDVFDPALVTLLGTMLDKMKEDMDKDPAIRLALADSYASYANGRKLFDGEMQTLGTTDAIDQRKAYEKGFFEWVNADEQRKKIYGSALESLAADYKTYGDASKSMYYYFLALFQGTSRGMNVLEYFSLAGYLDDPKANKESIDAMVAEFKTGLDDSFAKYFQATDKKVFEAMLNLYIKEIPAAERAEVFANFIFKTYKGKSEQESITKFINDVYARSIFVDKTRLAAFLEKPSKKVLAADPLYKFMESIYGGIMTVQMAYMGVMGKIDESERLYMEAMRKYQPERSFYPDANSTLRLTYGTVQDYDPRDAVQYHWLTYAEGILEKYVPGDLEFDVDPKLIQLIKNKDYGRYADKTGHLPVCFLSNNDITGGNSGSPIINGKGELIGLAFDGNWEWLCSNLIFSIPLQRTINVDSRYVLWVIDKYAGASNIIEELDIRQ
ncbi:MAG TPA: S46 family peptidase [Prolixibacteraceae bacterium]|nr:S46 family peptidase [Prolixibacteraceae bacterium]